MSDATDFLTKDRFIESPIFDNWFKKHYPKESLLIVSPYIKKDALDKVLALYDIGTRDDKIDLRVLIRGNANEFTHQKSSDVAAFDSLLSLQGFDIDNVKRVTNLHMKAYLVDGRHLLITSGNLTNSGMFVTSGKENFEGGISTNNISLIGQFVHYLNGIWTQGESLNDFYDELMSAYVSYIETEYSDKATLQRLHRKKYKFSSKTSFDQADVARHHIPINGPDSSLPGVLDVFLNPTVDNESVEIESQVFTLGDIPPVGFIDQIPEILNVVAGYPDGISYIELGTLLRPKFSDSESTDPRANRKFGEEKGKFAAFLNLVSIEKTKHGKIIRISEIGKAYMAMSDESKKKLIKDIFFDKPIVVSIMRHSFETPDFDLFKFLCKNCEGATESTLARKVAPLRSLFAHISAICTEDELKSALNLK